MSMSIIFSPRPRFSFRPCSVQPMRMVIRNLVRRSTEHARHAILSNPICISPGRAVLLPAGMQGDRASIVFSDPAEVGRLINKR